MFINSLKLNRYWYISVIALYICIVLKLGFSVSFGYFDYLIFAILGLTCLYQQFGTSGLKILMQKPKVNMWVWTPVVVLSSLFLGLVLMNIGNSLKIDSFAKNGLIDTILQSNDMLSKIMFFLIGWIQLIGEEMITAAICLPLLLILKSRIGYKKSLLISIICSSLVFGFIHLSTYEWNLYQSLVVIGCLRLPFTFMWFKSKSLIGGAIPHIVYDYLLILFAIII